MTAWTDLVSKIYKQNKGKPGYKLKNAMVDAKKVYKAPAAGEEKKSRKSRKSKKSRKSGKSRKTRRH